MSHDLRFRKLEDAWGIRPLSPEDEKTGEQILAELVALSDEVAAEFPGWIKRLRSGKVAARAVHESWSPVWQWRFTEDSKSCLMSLEGALYEFFEGRRNPSEGTPHAPDGLAEPTTAAEVADVLEKYTDELVTMIAWNRWLLRTNRAKQGFPAVPDFWRD